MKRKWSSSALFIGLILMSCGNNYSAEEIDQEAGLSYLDESDGIEQSENNLLTEEDLVLLDRKLIKTANLHFETESLNGTSDRVHAALKIHKGYIVSEKEYTSYGRENVQIDMKVPSRNFESLMSDVSEGVNQFESKDITATDVTEEFIDLEARIKTKKEVEKQFVGLLEKAQSIGEVMEVEKQIGIVREDIEAAEGRLKYLENNTSYSTVSLTFFRLVDAPSKYGQRFENSFDNGWNGLVMFFVGLTTLWPAFILGILSILLIRKFRKNKSLIIKNEKDEK